MAKYAFLLLCSMLANEALSSVRVALIHPADNTDTLTIDQLNDSERFDIRAEAITAAQASDPDVLAQYDVVMIGESHSASTNYPAAMFSAIRDFVRSGRGLITMSYFCWILSDELEGQAKTIANELSPIAPNGYQEAAANVAVTLANIDHPALAGLTNFNQGGAATGETCNAADRDAQILAINESENRVIAATKEVGAGHSVYLSFLYHALHGEKQELRTGIPDRLLEQMVVWLGNYSGEHHCHQNQGALKCWGANGSGELGQGHAEDLGDQAGEIPTLRPIDLGQGFIVDADAGGPGFHCAQSTGGQVKCWGENKSGQLGLGDTNNRGDDPGEMGDDLPPLDLEGQRAERVVMGAAHGCVLTRSGQVRCWGMNNFGQLGQGNTDNIGDQTGEVPRIVDLGGTVNVIAAAGNHTCVILETDVVKCWGRGGDGRLGYESSANIGDRPGQMGTALGAVDLGDFRAADLFLGTAHTCALSEDGRAKCWGANALGQLALGDSEPRGDDPGEMGDMLPTINLGRDQLIDRGSCGAKHCCATFLQGTMKCWGANSVGQLGYGDTRVRGADGAYVGDGIDFVPFQRLESIDGFFLGRRSTCAETERGLLCWGSNHNGELGQGDSVGRGASYATIPADISPIPLW